MTPAALLVLAKAPVPGLAKTRLCPPATPEQAAEIAAACLLDTLDAVHRTPGGRPVVAMTGSLDDAARADELRQALRGCLVLEQRGEAFGDRLANAHIDTAFAHPGVPVVQIGMDTPQVTPALLADACGRFASRSVDAVLGLAEDGGWWVAGFRDGTAAEALRRVPTSRHDTGSRTLASLRSHGLRVEPLPELSDVDTFAEAARLAVQLPGSRFAASVEARMAGGSLP